MKKQFSRWPVILSVFVVLFITGCGKDEADDTPPPKTNTEKISSSSWKFQSATAAGTDVSSNPQIACFVDNVITFNSNLTGNIDEATVICAPSTAGAFNWSFQSGETVLQLSTTLITGGSTLFTIVSLTEANLVLSQNVTITGFPAPVPVTVTLKH